jgi:proline dehydrogenase
VPQSLVWPIARRYIAGSTLADAIGRIRRLHTAGRRSTVDVLGEDLRTSERIEALMQECMRVLDAVGGEDADVTLSVKMTALGLRLNPEVCAANTLRLVDAAKQRSVVVELDMEDSTTTDATIGVYRRLRADGFDNVVLALQAYLRRTRDDARKLRHLRPRVRLVKGIFVEPPVRAFGDRDTVRSNFVRTLDELLDAGAYVAVASHDEWIHWQALDVLERRGVPGDGYEFQMLLGVREELGETLVRAGHPVRVYVPYGADWRAYVLRRFKENPSLAGYVAADVAGRLTGRVASKHSGPLARHHFSDA